MKALKGGWGEGTAKELLNLSDADTADVEKRLAAHRNMKAPHPAAQETVIQLEGKNPKPMEFMNWLGADSTEFLAKIAGEIQVVAINPALPSGEYAFEYDSNTGLHPFGKRDVLQITPCRLMIPPLDNDVLSIACPDMELLRPTPADEAAASRMKRTSKAKRKATAETNADALNQLVIERWANENHVDLDAMPEGRKAFGKWLARHVMVRAHVHNLDDLTRKKKLVGIAALPEYAGCGAGKETNHFSALCSSVRYRIALAGGITAYASACVLRSFSTDEQRELSPGMTADEIKRIASEAGSEAASNVAKQHVYPEVIETKRNDRGGKPVLEITSRYSNGETVCDIVEGSNPVMIVEYLLNKKKSSPKYEATMNEMRKNLHLPVSFRIERLFLRNKHNKAFRLSRLDHPGDAKTYRLKYS